ncbi:MAG: hypothetical protein K0R68_373, partial [Mycobacterium sp.]|nr:hypothetical protein [Mycobacterium sp.]
GGKRLLDKAGQVEKFHKRYGRRTQSSSEAGSAAATSSQA